MDGRKIRQGPQTGGPGAWSWEPWSGAGQRVKVRILVAGKDEEGRMYLGKTVAKASSGFGGRREKFRSGSRVPRRAVGRGTQLGTRERDGGSAGGAGGRGGGGGLAPLTQAASQCLWR